MLELHQPVRWADACLDWAEEVQPDLFAAEGFLDYIAIGTGALPLLAAVMDRVVPDRAVVLGCEAKSSAALPLWAFDPAVPVRYGHVAEAVAADISSRAWLGDRIVVFLCDDDYSADAAARLERIRSEAAPAELFVLVGSGAPATAAGHGHARLPEVIAQDRQ